ncbi:g6462 [Coccomyxa elongata]
MSMQKEKRIRERVEGIFNKQETEFSSKSQYYDYLEEREDIIYNLIEGIDLDEMEARIAAYQRENRDNIMENEARKAEEARARADRAAGTSKAGKTGASTSAPKQQHEGPTKYIATAAMPSAPPPAQPAPRPSAAPTAGPSASEPASREQIEQASGWNQSFQHQRLLQEAYSTTFLKPLPSTGQLVE